VRLKAPLLLARLSNAVLRVGAVVYVYAGVRAFASQRAALVAAYALGLHPSTLRQVHQLLSENLSYALVAAFAFHLAGAMRYARAERATAQATGEAAARDELARTRRLGRRDLWLAAIALAWLALTKVFFGYLVLPLAALYGVWFAVTRLPAVRRAALVCVGAAVLCLPYLTYTYALTGRVFYWGNSGGQTLYWMSSPFPQDLGDWQSPRYVLTDPTVADRWLSTRAALETGTFRGEDYIQPTYNRIRNWSGIMERSSSG
jgi:4-amino-4-deoxy-L-arabinose transferase-like glycosyltransferase